MEIRNGPIPFFSLLFHSLKVANQAFGSVLALVLLLGLIIAMCAGIIMGASFFFGPQITLVLYIPILIFGTLLYFVFLTASTQILAAKIEQRGFSAWEGLSGSFIPAIYFCISSVLLTAAWYAVLFAAQLANSSAVVAICTIALFFAMLPFLFTLHAIALRDEGPFTALRYSWELAAKYYVRIICYMAGLFVLALFLGLAAICIIKATAPQIMLLLMSQVNPLFLLQPSATTITAVIVVCLIYLYITLTVQAFFTGLFLSLDYACRSGVNRESQPAEQADASQPASATNTLAEGVTLKQASIRTDSDADPDTARHLDQVYRAQEHLAQALEQEEDRMPTILFDEDMAKQLAENEEQMRKQQEQSAQRKENDEPQTIKISDKPL